MTSFLRICHLFAPMERRRSSHCGIGVFVRSHEAVEHVENSDDEPDEYGHENDGLAAGAAPDDDEGAEGDFRQSVEDDEIGLRDFAENLAPPKQQGDDISGDDGDEEAEQGFPERGADVVKEGSVLVQGDERGPDARGGACDKGIDPLEVSGEFPKDEKEREHRDSYEVNGNALSFQVS